MDCLSNSSLVYNSPSTSRRAVILCVAVITIKKGSKEVCLRKRK